jgi:hypothetical protein
MQQISLLEAYTLKFSLELVLQNGEGTQREDQKSAEFLQSLYFPEMDNRRLNIQRAHEKTCDWIYATKEYQDWLSRANVDTDLGLLWVKGKPGSGKSTLMKEILYRAQQDATHEDDPGTNIAGTFFNARSAHELEKTSLGTYRALLHQLLSQDRVVLSRLAQRYARKASALSKSEVVWHIEELQDMLIEVFEPHQDKKSRSKGARKMKQDDEDDDGEKSMDSRRIGARPTVMIIDAMDECEEHDVEGLVRFIKKLSKRAYEAGAKLNICLSSRHYPNISIKNCPEVVVEAHNRADILTYIQSEAEDNRAISELADKIFNRSAGVFLWVVLTTAMLRKDGRGKSTRAMEQKLMEIPPQLDALFRSLFSRQRPGEAERAISLMRLVHIAQRPLDVDELYIALCFENTAYVSLTAWKASVDYLETEEMRHELVTELSKGLLELQYDAVAGDRPSKPSPWDHESSSGDDESTPSIDDATTSEDGILIHESTKQGSSIHGSSIHGSSIHESSIHESTRAPPKRYYQFIHETVREFCLSGEGFRPLGYEFSNVEGVGHSALAHACMNYLNTERSPSERVRTGSGNSSAAAAVQGLPHDPTVTFDTRTEVDVDSEAAGGKFQDPAYSWTFLDPAYSWSFLTYVRRYLFRHLELAENHGVSQEANLALLNARSRKILQHLSAIYIRLEMFPWSRHDYYSRNINNSVDFTYDSISPNSTMLMAAVATESPQTASRILAMGFHVDEVSDNPSRLALLLAASTPPNETPSGYLRADSKHFESQTFMVRLLLDAGADISAVNARGETALHVAVMIQNMSAVSLLLARGASVHARDSKGRTPLHRAFFGRVHLTIIELLLNYGARLDVVDQRGRRPGPRWPWLALMKARLNGLSATAIGDDMEQPKQQKKLRITASEP